MEDIKKPILYALRKLTTEQFALSDESFMPSKIFNCNVTLNFALDHKKRMLAVFSQIEIEKDNLQIIKIEIGCHFEIEPESYNSLVNEEMKTAVFSKEFIMNLTSIAIGATRGALHVKTENTPFNLYFIPIIKVNDLIQEEITFDLNLD